MSGAAARTVLVLAALAVGVPEARADVLCRKKGGGVVARTACTKRQRPIAVPVTQGPTGAPGRLAPRHVDANGRRVGVASEPLFEGSFVAIDVGERLVWVAVDRDGFEFGRGEEFLSFYHVGPDCSGERFGRVNPEELVRAAVGRIGATLYYASDPVTEQVTRSLETLAAPDVCEDAGGTVLANGLCCKMREDSEFVGPVVLFDLAPLGLAAPYRIAP
jgi:hypothetical protein